MRKAKSRNFILVVCGVLIILLLGLVIAKTIISVIDEVSNEDMNEKLQKNILSSSSKIKLYGKGNFIDSTPKVERTVISDFNVKLSDKYDEVYYSMSFCNMNNSDLKYRDLVIEAVSCNDHVGEGCSGISVDAYVMKNNRKVDKGMIVSANSCVNVVVDVKATVELNAETEVNISRVALELVDAKS